MSLLETFFLHIDKKDNFANGLKNISMQQTKKTGHFCCCFCCSNICSYWSSWIPGEIVGVFFQILILKLQFSYDSRLSCTNRSKTKMNCTVIFWKIVSSGSTKLFPHGMDKLFFNRWNCLNSHCVWCYFQSHVVHLYNLTSYKYMHLYTLCTCIFKQMNATQLNYLRKLIRYTDMILSKECCISECMQITSNML